MIVEGQGSVGEAHPVRNIFAGQRLTVDAGTARIMVPRYLRQVEFLVHRLNAGNDPQLQL